MTFSKSNKRFYLTNLRKLKSTIFFVLVLYFLFINTFFSQSIRYYFQGFESVSGNNCPENWPYSGGNLNGETFRNGSQSARIGRLGESNTLTLQPVDVSNLISPVLTIYHSIRSGSGPGMDTREGAVFLISLNGQPYSFVSGVGGFGDHSYNWTSSEGGSATVSAGCSVFQTPNPFIYPIPSGITSISVQIVSVRVSSSNCTTFNTNMNSGITANYDRSDEGFFVDDIEITAVSPLVTSTNNGTICQGSPLDLVTTPNLVGFSHSWSGPNAFSSILGSPSVSLSATAMNQGIYSNSISLNGCSLGLYSTEVIVLQTPSIIAISPP